MTANNVLQSHKESISYAIIKYNLSLTSARFTFLTTCYVYHSVRRGII